MNSSYHEEQSFPAWIKAVAIAPLVVVAALAVAAVSLGSAPAGVIAVILLVIFGPLALPQLFLRMITTVDAQGLHVRLRPAAISLLPRRMASKDVPLSEITAARLQKYASASDREFWGWKVWGLSAGKNGRYLYGMRPTGVFTITGIRVETSSGEVLLIGTGNPAGLLAALRGPRSHR